MLLENSKASLFSILFIIYPSLGLPKRQSQSFRQTYIQTDSRYIETVTLFKNYPARGQQSLTQGKRKKGFLLAALEFSGLVFLVFFQSFQKKLFFLVARPLQVFFAASLITIIIIIEPSVGLPRYQSLPSQGQRTNTGQQSARQNMG